MNSTTKISQPKIHGTLIISCANSHGEHHIRSYPLRELPTIPKRPSWITQLKEASGLGQIVTADWWHRLNGNQKQQHSRDALILSSIIAGLNTSAALGELLHDSTANVSAKMARMAARNLVTITMGHVSGDSGRPRRYYAVTETGLALITKVKSVSSP